MKNTVNKMVQTIMDILVVLAEVSDEASLANLKKEIAVIRDSG